MALACRCQKLITAKTLAVEKRLNKLGRIIGAERFNVNCLYIIREGRFRCEFFKDDIIQIKPRNSEALRLMREIDRLLKQIGTIIGATAGIGATCFKLADRNLYNCACCSRRFRFEI